MGRVRWHTMMSLDGFTSGPDDDMGWVFSVDGGDGEIAAEVVAATGALLVGCRTQDVEDRLQPGFLRRRLQRAVLRYPPRSTRPWSRASRASSSTRPSRGRCESRARRRVTLTWECWG
jgi:hypothetical protein